MCVEDYTCNTFPELSKHVAEIPAGGKYYHKKLTIG